MGTSCTFGVSFAAREYLLLDVKMFYHRPIRCVASVHLYFLAQRDTDPLAENAHLSCARMCIDVSSFPPDQNGDKHATSNRRQKKELSNGETLATETKQVSRNLLTNIILYGRTIVYTMNSAIGMDKKSVGYYFRIFDPGKNGLQSTDDVSMKLKCELVLGDPNNNFLYISIRADDKVKSTVVRLHEVDPLRNANGNIEVITIADIRHIQRWFGHTGCFATLVVFIL